jgi:DNA transformation protein and related proteins
VSGMPDVSFRDFVLDQLRDLDGLECRGMFGGYGLHRGETFFGIIHKGQLYFKTGTETLPNYVARGSGPFRPSAKQTLKYYEVPVEIIEDRQRLTEWAGDALRVRPRRRGGRAVGDRSGVEALCSSAP